MRKGWRPSAVIFFKTGPNAFLLIAVAGLKSGKNSSVTLFCAHFTGYACRAPFRISDLSCHLSTRKMRVRGRSEPLPPSYTRCARSISMSRPLKEGIHLERLARRINSCIWTLHPFWKSHQSNIVPPAPVLHICHLLGESLQLIL